MPLKDNILRELGENGNSLTSNPFYLSSFNSCLLFLLLVPEPRSKYTSESDKIILEDESGRLTLLPFSTTFAHRNGIFVTGMTVAMLGRELLPVTGGDEGGFEVIDVCYPK